MTAADLEALFPGLAGTAYRVTSPPTQDYNCVAWAAGVTTAWWWPEGDPPRHHWPPVAPREETLAAFAAAFAAVGFRPCADDGVEAGVEKVALFARAGGLPTHAARQLPSGRWTSKLGELDDVEHDLHALEGDVYGRVALVLARPRDAGS